MGRRVNPRANYRDYAIYLHRYLTAFEVDERFSPEYRQCVSELARVLIRELLEPVPTDPANDEQKPFSEKEVKAAIAEIESFREKGLAKNNPR